MTSPDDLIYDLRTAKKRALIEGARRKAADLIAALHDLDGSTRGGAFHSAHLGRARDNVEAAMAEIERP